MPAFRQLIAGLFRRWSPEQSAPAMEAATQLAPAPQPKVKSGQQTFPSYLRTATPSQDSALPYADRHLVNKDLTSFRFGLTSRQVVRDIASSNPDVAAAVYAYIRTAITGSYTTVAKNMDGTFNREATNLLQQLLVRFDVVKNYDDGFSGIGSMRSNSESLAKDLLFYGAMSGELVLDKARLPYALQPISSSQILFFPDKQGGLRPIQKLSGEEIDLDIPTFFHIALDQDLLEPYAYSPLEPALQPALFSQEFMNDLRKIVKRVVHPRLLVKINEELFRKFIPPEIRHDNDQLNAYLQKAIDDIAARVNGLKPEDAFVFFDQIGVEMMNNGNQSLGKEYEVLEAIMNSKMATGAKALPSILGHGSGSQNIASSETLLFMKAVEGAVQMKLNEFWSRVLTLGLRLFGLDVYVEFKYAPIDLRPDSELESFRAMFQSRILEQLSLGFLTDDDASLKLTGQLTPVGFKPLMGTGFMNPVKADPNANPHSGKPGQQGGGSHTQNTGTPTQPKGGQKKAEVELTAVK